LPLTPKSHDPQYRSRWRRPATVRPGSSPLIHKAMKIAREGARDAQRFTSGTNDRADEPKRGRTEVDDRDAGLKRLSDATAVVKKVPGWR